MESPVRKIFDKINKLRTVSLSALKKVSARVELILINNDIISIDKYTRKDIREKLKAIHECSTLIEFREYDNGEFRLHNANFCKNPIVCPVCASRVSNKRRALYLPAIEKAVERYSVPEEVRIEKNYPEGYTGVYMCTATMRPGTNLEERINHLSESILRFRKMGQKRKSGYSDGEWKNIKAALSNIEIKIGSGSGQWHVHAHFLVFTDEPLNIKLYDSPYFIEINDKENPGQKKKHTLSKVQYEWYMATGGDFLFDVKPIQYREWVHEVKCDTFAQSIMLQSAEVFKYNTKLTEEGNLEGLSDWQYIELIQRRGGRRLFNAVGEFRCDSRNERSLMTVTEKEVKRLEYIDKYDSFTYQIYSSQYRKDLYGYSDLQHEEEAVFKNSDDMMSKFKDLRKYAFSSIHSKVTADYRKTRNQEIKTMREMARAMQLKDTGVYHFEEIRDNFESYIDDLKEHYRRNVRDFWHNFNLESVQVHIYPEQKKFVILKNVTTHVMPEEKKDDAENFRDYLHEMRKEFKNMEFPEKNILASNMTPEELKIHQNNSPDKYMIV
jgi:hypothetical protein